MRADIIPGAIFPEIVAVPTSPVILVSADQSRAALLERGVKGVQELRRAAEAAR